MNPGAVRSDRSEQLDRRRLLAAMRAFRRGEFSVRLPDDLAGLDGQICEAFNELVHYAGSLSSELAELRAAVRIEGRTHRRLHRGPARGGWAAYVAGVNDLLDDVTSHTADVARVLTAVGKGDLSQNIDLEGKDAPLRGDFLRHARLVNGTVAQLAAFSSEVTRVAHEVAVDGKLGAQARVRGLAGVWKELTDSVNLMASNLTDQVREIARVTTAVASGDLTKSVTIDAKGELLELKNTINIMVAQLSSFAAEVTRVAREVGTDGVLGGQAHVGGVSGVWRELTRNVNSMANNLTIQVRNIAEVSAAIAAGDLSKKITVDVKGELLELKNTINTMVDQLNAFAAEVTRVAREVGTEGVLGGEAEVRGVSGVWRDLTDNVNLMARNLTEQVRGIAHVVTAVANGDLDQKLTLAAQGEIATLVDTINAMTVTLSTFAEQVIGVARDVGVEGRLGGQAGVPGAAGVWRDLTNNVNELAGNLTRQVRAIGDVATAVTKGDLTQSITVDARGEVALLKDNVNQMIRTLAETTQVNQEQDWLKTNLTRFTRMLQGQRDLLTVADQVLAELAAVVAAQHGSFYVAELEDDGLLLKLFAAYAYKERKSVSSVFRLGEGLVGQAAREKKPILVTDVPPDYVRISSSLGEAAPLNLVVVPISFEGEIKGVLELASFHRFTPVQLAFLEQLVESLGIVIATIRATMRTSDLLRQSQSMAEELQIQQEALQKTNEELEEKARQLTDQKSEVERKNVEVELARQELEEKAEQLATTSRYKSQFLANMSHELRTPLNSLLILSRQLAGNRERNLTGKQLEFARTIHQSGTELLRLINEVLDLAKIESGTMSVDPVRVAIADLTDYVERSFCHVAAEKQLEFGIEVADGVATYIETDDMRLRQVLRNLISNAVKFTERGSVKLQIFRAERPEWSVDNEVLNHADSVIAFAVCDTGIGIPKDKQRIIFEAFQQADGGTSRKYGGTGLGLAISREIAGLLGGELRVNSEVERGSVFTLYLPEVLLRGRRPTAPPGTMPPSPMPPTSATDPSVAVESPARIPRYAFSDDRHALQPGDRVLLIIEDDEAFARTLLDCARANEFRGVVVANGAQGLELARSLQPDAVTLDLRLPDIDGWVLLDQLKRNPLTRHIPVHVITASGDELLGLGRGAIGVLSKPATSEALDGAMQNIGAYLARTGKHVLIVQRDTAQHDAMMRLLSDEEVVVSTSAPAEAASRLEAQAADCVVVNLSPGDTSGLELLGAMAGRESWRRTPVLVYPGTAGMAEPERSELERLARCLVIRFLASPEALLDQVCLFLHRDESKLSFEKRQILRKLTERDPELAGRSVLIVDDDVRNLFAITGVLEPHAMRLLYAENGRDAIRKLDQNDVDIVLMDIMMPEMDGYEAMQRIRSNDRMRGLPIIALTAKAMPGDREKCLQAGASDYITKPLDSAHLLSLLRVWLHRGTGTARSRQVLNAQDCDAVAS